MMRIAESFEERGMPASETERRPVGRPSVAEDRRPQIVEAFIECIRRYGLQGATIDKVASRLKVSKSLVFHYFGDTDSLVAAATEHIVDRFLDRLPPLREIDPGNRTRALLEYFFEGPQFDMLADALVEAEIFSLAGRDKRVRQLSAEAWERYIEAIGDALRVAYPEASLAECRRIGYALACLTQQHWEVTFLGPGAERHRDARKAAELLLASLTPNKPERD